ncbi:MAG: bifunctional shikimate kinase/3-dehydroquinate synthase [Anaerolineae bacterium]|nr:MAG: bifunctional shikimate kinase/3-dehydroquinate synthase [Anaerolineae bacterium]
MSQLSSGTSRVAEGQLRLQPMNIVLAGPPGAGKSAVGRLLGERLGREFVDTDDIVERMSGKPIHQIFDEDGELTFRRMEIEACLQVAEPADRVIACGGGALMDEGNRILMEAGGALVCLTGEPEALLARLGSDGSRPLLEGASPSERLQALLESRQDAYDSIPVQLDTTALTVEEVADRIADYPLSRRTVRMTARRPRPGYEVLLGEGLIANLSTWLEKAQLPPPYMVVSDSNVAPLYERVTRKSLECSFVTVPAGEEHKSQETLFDLYTAFIKAGLDRSSTVIALGGGVLLDLAGFAAATYMRGIRWAALPTTLLATVDASLGGKVGINLEGGKNLIGAFHAPSIVLADLTTLTTLPEEGTRTGLAEMIKAALIGDADLFTRMESGPPWISRSWIQRAMEVKLSIVDEDPNESDRRAALNLGHTFAHGLEAASCFSLPHGQAVSVGLVGATRLAYALGRCEADLQDRVQNVLLRFGLPNRFVGLDTERIMDSMKVDKKRREGRSQFVIPLRPGQVETGIEAPESLIRDVVDGLRETR